MTLCPIALTVHCVGCPIVGFCPAKTIIGDYGKYQPPRGGKGEPTVRLPPPQKK